MFSKSTEYALRAAIFIASNASAEKKVSIKMVAEGIGAPLHFTAKILQQLTKKDTGIISSVTGPAGGLFISEKAKNLPAITIIKLMGDMKVIESCILGLPKCSDASPCPMHNSYKTIRQHIIKMFAEKTIGELADTNKLEVH